MIWHIKRLLQPPFKIFIEGKKAAILSDLNETWRDCSWNIAASLYVVHVPKFLVLAYTSLKYKKGLKQPKNTDRKGWKLLLLRNMYWTATDKGLLFPGYVLRLLEGSNSLTPRRQVVLDILLPSKVRAGLAFSEIARAKPIKYLTSAWKLPHCEIASDFCYAVIFRGQMWLEKCLNFCKIWLFRRVPWPSNFLNALFSQVLYQIQ